MTTADSVVPRNHSFASAEAVGIARRERDGAGADPAGHDRSDDEEERLDWVLAEERARGDAHAGRGEACHGHGHDDARRRSGKDRAVDREDASEDEDGDDPAEHIGSLEDIANILEHGGPNPAEMREIRGNDEGDDRIDAEAAQRGEPLADRRREHRGDRQQYQRHREAAGRRRDEAKAGKEHDQDETDGQGQPAEPPFEEAARGRARFLEPGPHGRNLGDSPGKVMGPVQARTPG